MMARTENLRLAVAACVFAVIAEPATAADSSRWDGDARSAIRLIAGTVPAGAATVRAGIEIRLKPGWHTYWRYPGDAGIPPRFDFQGSQNVKSVEVRWPAPKRQPEGSVMTIGYDRDVILPLAIVPEDPAKPVTLRLKADYAICEKLCAPVEGKAELTIMPGASKLEPQLAAAEGLVPKRQALGEGDGLVIRSAVRDRQAEAARRGRRGSAARNQGRSVCRGSDPGLGLAGAGARERRARRAQPFHLRPRRCPARHRLPRFAPDAHGGRRDARPSRSRSVSTNPAGTLTCAPCLRRAARVNPRTPSHPSVRGRKPCPSRSATGCPPPRFAF